METVSFIHDYIFAPIVGVLVLFTIFLLVFTRLKLVRHIRCHVLTWHSAPHYETTGFDGCSVHARCKWCGYKGMIDSQGNLF